LNWLAAAEGPPLHWKLLLLLLLLVVAPVLLPLLLVVAAVLMPGQGPAQSPGGGRLAAAGQS
jgi:hypothetical protein